MKFEFWHILPYLLPVISYVVGRYKNCLRVPKSISRLVEDTRVVEIVIRGVEAAQEMRGKSDDEKREYVRSWVKSELYKLLGEWLPDSAINFLIEHVIVRRKG